MTSSQRERRRGWTTVVLLLGMGLAWGEEVRGQSSAEVPAGDEAAVPPAVEPAPPTLADDPSAPPAHAAEDRLSRLEQQARRREALAGLAALVGIVLVGLALIAWIMAWAARLRRWNRPPPATTAWKQEFWFLKPPKPPVSDSPPEARGTNRPD